MDYDEFTEMSSDTVADGDCQDSCSLDDDGSFYSEENNEQSPIVDLDEDQQ